MKTKITFEEADFDSCGQMIIRNHCTSITTAYKVGYGHIETKGEINRYYFLISLADGMLCYQSDSIQELVEKINEDSEFRPMTTDEIKTVLGEQGNRFKPYSK